MKALNTSSAQLTPNLNVNTGLQTGVVTLVGEQHYQVSTKSGTVTAIKADSCLLTPQKNDSVIVAEMDYDLAVIIAIIKQANREQQTYQLNPGVHLTTNNGQLAIISEQFDCIASQQANIYTQNLSLNAENAAAKFNRYTINTTFYSEMIGHLESVAAIIDQTVETHNFTAKHSFEEISELQHRVIGNLHMLVDKNYRLDCETADIYSEGDIKLEAAQIHMG